VLTVSFIVCLQQFTKDDRSIIFEFTIMHCSIRLPQWRRRWT